MKTIKKTKAEKSETKAIVDGLKSVRSDILELIQQINRSDSGEFCEIYELPEIGFTVSDKNLQYNGNPRIALWYDEDFDNPQFIPWMEFETELIKDAGSTEELDWLIGLLEGTVRRASAYREQINSTGVINHAVPDIEPIEERLKAVNDTIYT